MKDFTVFNDLSCFAITTAFTMQPCNLLFHSWNLKMCVSQSPDWFTNVLTLRWVAFL